MIKRHLIVLTVFTAIMIIALLLMIIRDGRIIHEEQRARLQENQVSV